MHNKIKLLLNKIALDEKLTYDEVEEIYRLSYRGVKSAIESGDKKTTTFNDVRMIGLGSFIVPEHVKNFWRKYNEKNNNDSL